MLIHSSQKLAASIVLLALAAATPAHATLLIDFETVPGVTANSFTLAGFSVPPGSHLSTQLQSTYGVTFTSTAGYVQLVQLGPMHATSGLNGIGGVSAGEITSYESPVDITFSLPGSPMIPAVTSVVSLSFDQQHIAGTATIEAFNLAGASLGSTTVLDTSAEISISAGSPLIHSVRLTQTSNTIAYDDLSFGDLTIAAVPEASTFVAWTAILSCIVGVGRFRKAIVAFKHRRRRLARA